MATNEQLTALEKMEYDLVMQLGRKIGFGRILQLAPECWDEYLGMGKDGSPGRIHAASARDKCGPQALSELARLRAKLDGLADTFDSRADDCATVARSVVDDVPLSSDYEGRAAGYRYAAAHVRGIVNADTGKGGEDE